MRGRGARAALLATAAVAFAALAGCGGENPDEVAARRLTEARAYATGVSAVSQRTSARLAAISEGADYRDATSAASSTREYAQVIGDAATELERATAPEQAADEHRELVALYRTTAGRMDELAAAFTQVRGAPDLTARAQELSGEVQRLATRERELRLAIERDLPAATTPSGATTPAEAVDPVDPGDPG